MSSRILICGVAVAIATAFVPPAAAQQLPQNPELYQSRRARLGAAMQPGAIAVVMSARKNQDDIYEFFVPHADNHDFMYLTGLEGPESYDSAILLCPGAEQYREILYTSSDPEKIKRRTGIVHVLPYSKFLEDLSEALTDFSLIRTHQRGVKPLSTDISRSLGANKYLYFNFPRFVNLSAVAPARLEVANKVRYFSPEVQLKDASELLDRMRMIHDESEIGMLRKASAITVTAFVESMKKVRPGTTTRDAAAMVDYVFAASGATPSFPTNVGNWALGAGYSGDRTLKAGDVISYDIGAEYGHQTSDFGRTIPVAGTFTPRQQEVYESIVRIQKQLIASVKPGGTFAELQRLKDGLVAEAGLADKTAKFGISHFVGMEVHDVGDYEVHWQPNMCFVIEWRIELDGVLMRFEDVILVTRDGHDWLTGSAPIDPEDYERIMLKKPASSGSRQP